MAGDDGHEAARETHSLSPRGHTAQAQHAGSMAELSDTKTQQNDRHNRHNSSSTAGQGRAGQGATWHAAPATHPHLTTGSPLSQGHPHTCRSTAKHLAAVPSHQQDSSMAGYVDSPATVSHNSLRRSSRVVARPPHAHSLALTLTQAHTDTEITKSHKQNNTKANCTSSSTAHLSRRGAAG